MDSGEFRQGNAPAALEFLTRFDSVFDVLKPTAQEGQLTDAAWTPSSKSAPPPRKPETSHAPTRFANSFWTRASSGRHQIRRALEEEISCRSTAKQYMRATAKSSAPTSPLRPPFTPRRATCTRAWSSSTASSASRSPVPATRATTTYRPRRLKSWSPRSKAVTARWRALPAWRPCTSPSWPRWPIAVNRWSPPTPRTARPSAS